MFTVAKDMVKGLEVLSFANDDKKIAFDFPYSQLTFIIR